MQRSSLAYCVTATIWLAGCSGTAPQIDGLSAGTGAAYASSSADTKEQATPFGQLPDPSDGARKIIEKPTLDDIALTGPLPEMALGKPNAPVTVVQYASLTCPHCRAFHDKTFPEFKRTYIDTGRVRYVLREFPIGKQSGTATIALRCAKPDKYFDLYAKFMQQQAAWVSQEVRTEPIFAVAKQVGMTRPEFDACLQNQGMIEGLKWVKERGRTLGIIGTPNFFVQGQLIKSTPNMKEMRDLIEPLLANPQSASASQSKAAPH